MKGAYMKWIREIWWRLYMRGRWRRRLRDGVIAMLEVNEMMIQDNKKTGRWPRQRRRHFMRDLQRDPKTWLKVLTLIHGQVVE